MVDLLTYDLVKTEKTQYRLLTNINVAMCVSQMFQKFGNFVCLGFHNIVAVTVKATQGLLSG